MGRLEKQIVIGALALVGFLMGVVVWQGLGREEILPGGKPPAAASSDWVDPADAAGHPALPAPSLQIPAAGSEPAPVRIRPRTHEADAVLLVEAPASSALPSEVQEEAPPEPEDAPVPAWPREHRVRAGETLSDIAQAYYGKASLHRLIEAANPGLRAETLQIGQLLVLPAPPETGERAPASAEAPAARAAKGPGGRLHVVEPGDSLWKIAVEYYGKGHLKSLIVEANPELGGEDAVLRIGQKLRVPELQP